MANPVIRSPDLMSQPDAFGNYYRPEAQVYNPYQQHVHHNSYKKIRARRKSAQKISKRTGTVSEVSPSRKEDGDFLLYDDTEARIENIRNNREIFR